MNNKGIFFTFGALFLAMLILALSILGTSTLNQANLRLLEAGSFARVYSLDKSLQRVINNLDEGIDILVITNNDTGNSNITLSETLDTNFEAYNTEFLTNIENLASFIESDEEKIKFNLSLINNETEKVPLIIKPHNIKYTHMMKNNENFIVVYFTESIPSLGFDLTLPNSQVASIDWQNDYPGSDVTFYINATGQNGITYSLEEGLSLAEGDVNKFKVGPTFITVKEGYLELDRANTLVQSTFGASLPYLNDMVTVNYPEGLYKINFTETGIFINSTIRVL